MRHHNSVLHQVLQHVPWAEFDRLVEQHGADRRVRRLSTRNQFVAMLYGQLSGSTSLREIETALHSHRDRLYHVGLRGVSRSTLADANARRPAGVFADLFRTLVAKLRGGLRRKVGEAVRLIDSTSLRLAGRGSRWAHFSHDVCGVKAHIVYDPDDGCPIYAAVTRRSVNDITAARVMPIEPGATYVFDLGYCDYAWWAKLHQAECVIVTRFVATTPLQVPVDLPLDPETTDASVLSDRLGFLPARQRASRRNPMDVPVREVRIKTETGKILRLFSNDLSASAQEIADLYKRRWQIELFFRWVKQVLKIKHLTGRSENAIRIQIAVALIAFLLLRLVQAATPILKVGSLAFARLIRANVMHRRSIGTLLAPQPPPANPQNQVEFVFS